MTDFKIYGRCFTCKQNHFFIRKRIITLKSIAQPIRSRELFCSRCFKKLQAAYKKGILS